MDLSVLFCGFGGQGILFMGKFLAYFGMISGKEVTWIPSYGAEMRGGTANCGVVISDGLIGSPVVANPDILVAMSLPSLLTREQRVKTGGSIFIESSLISRETERKDITAYHVPATKIADENNMKILANMVMIGNFLTQQGLYDKELIREAMTRTVPERKKNLLDFNLKAIELGREYKDGGNMS